jgi:uncharacterized glyoxalase superfamily protein PhnB
MTHYQPDGWPTVIPRIVTTDVPGVVGFIKSVIGAEGDLRAEAPTELRIGDSLIMVSDGGGLREAMPAFLYVYVEDTDSTYRLAIASGASAIEEPADMPYGDRRAMVRDLWGNIWQIATHRGSFA